jgi:hypothetical protein
MIVMGCFISFTLHAQKRWDGGAGTAFWADDANWFPDGVPLSTDDVLLDNSLVPGNYHVLLPTGAITLTLPSLTLHPGMGSITAELPAANTANPGLSVRDLVLHPGAVFINASGASAGSGIALAGALTINNGARYVHRTQRSNAGIIDRILIQPGTEKGIFEFDVPGAAGYTVSLTGNNFGSLFFRASAAGGAKSYSGSGIGTLTIHGDLQVEAGASLTSTLSADIVLKGDLRVDGRFSLNPSTAGTVARSLRFAGSGQYSGSGTLSMNTNFRNIEVAPGSALTLQRPLTLPLSPHTVLVRGSLVLGLYHIDGPGSFLLADSAILSMGDPGGISATTDAGNIRTTTRQFSAKAIYIYAGSSPQVTGDGLPDSVSALGINNAGSLTLTRSVYIRDSLLLTLGLIRSSASARPMLGSPVVRSGPGIFGPGLGNGNSFVSGPLGLHLITDSAFAAPIGADTVFAPIRFTLKEAGRPLIVVGYQAGPPPTANRSPLLQFISDREYWSLQEPLPASVQMDISLRPWSLPNLPQTRPALASLDVQWEKITGTGPGSGYRWLRADSVVRSAWAFAPALELESTVLPLSIIDLTAHDQGDGVRLSWEVEDDGRPALFRIMRSAEGRNFSEIGTLRSPGLGRSRQSWVDINPLPLGYYQLHMVSEKGEARSRIIRKTVTRRYARIWPNPVREEIHIFFSGPRSRFEVEVVSLFGTVCKKFVCNTANCQMRVSDLSRGFYLLRITDENGSVILPFTKD